jgi:NitT/TauT family transport system permease protein
VTGLSSSGSEPVEGRAAGATAAGRHRLLWGWVLPAASVAGLVLLWQLAAGLAQDDLLLPSPATVFGVLARITASGELPYHLGVTLARVAASFVLAMAIGVAIGFAMGRSEVVDRLALPWLVFFLNLPALVTIVLAYIWIGLVETAVIVAVAANKIPNVVVTVREGARALDPDLAEMAQSFRLGLGRRLRHVVLPQLYPFIAAAARSGLALIWKIVLVVELLGRSNGVGFQLGLAFQLFDVAAILAYAIAFIAVIQVIEWTLLQPLERRVSLWRR